jgi:N utilization substance protein B
LRQKAVQALYQIDVGKADESAAIEHVIEETSLSSSDKEYLQKLVKGTFQEQMDIDRLLTENVQNWSMDRIGRVELNVLRLSIYELLNELDVDVATIVNEAVELAKVFSTEEAGRFVNGVLARVLPVINDQRQSSLSQD